MVRVMVTRSVSTPSSSTIHRLGAARCGTLLVVVAVWASITVVSSVLAVLVEPAPPVLVIRVIMVAGGIRIPGTNAVHGLGATRRGTLVEIVRVGAAITIVSSVGGDLVVSAPSVLVVIVVVAFSVWIPRTNAVHGLSTLSCRALLVIICK